MGADCEKIHKLFYKKSIDIRVVYDIIRVSKERYLMKTIFRTKVQPKQTRLPMTKEELRTYYEQVKGSARVSENPKAYKRSRDKRVAQYE
jgi:hypothetical protein